jgi:mono/diheme cytochrome c family protein
VLGIVLAGSVALTLVVALALVRGAPRLAAVSAPIEAQASGAAPPASPGIRATIEAGGISVQRELSAMAFRVGPGEALDRRLPPGPFRGIFHVAFAPGPVQAARVGAHVQGGQIILRRRGRVLLSDYGDASGKEILTREPQFLGGGGLVDLEIEFVADGDGPAALRALWQPELAQVPLPLPAAGRGLAPDEWLQGMALMQRLNCVRCHASGDERLQASLTAAAPPRLDRVGARARPDWIGRWIAHPGAARDGAAMPRLLHDRPADEVEDLVHFLVSLSPPLPTRTPPPDPGAVATGMVLYHEVGCVPCHGPLEPRSRLPGGWGDDAEALRSYASMGNLEDKTTIEGLTRFLVDPLAARPSGQMPSLRLSRDEAGAIASYLIARQPAQAAAAPFAVEGARAERGRRLFASSGCANCHALDPGGGVIAPGLPARSLESLAAGPLERGCAGPMPVSGAPHYDLSPAERRLLGAFLETVAEPSRAAAPIDGALAAMTRLNCAACHEVYGASGPEPAIAGYFRTRGEADLGDEGRVPPSLTDAGGKLNPGWLRQVLEEDGAVRPYLAARMPVFGADNVAPLLHGLPALAGRAPEPDHGPAFDLAAARAGRDLVGSAGLNCIQCHDIAGRPATGTPGPDLARMTERLRFDSFRRWLTDPAQVRPGTRMPSFFVGGRSAIERHFGGAAAEQVGAMWSYLSQGDLLPLPEGLVDPAGLALEVTDAPLVFRTFMTSAGVRAIACGFPEQVHCAFDADRCRLISAWQGKFLNAAGAWAARGGSITDPGGLSWTAPEGPVLAFEGAAAEPRTSFRGYRLDAERRPIFMYDLQDGPVVVAVEEQPLPRRDGMRVWLVRRFALSGPKGTVIQVNHGAGQRVTLGPDGSAHFELEVSW